MAREVSKAEYGIANDIDASIQRALSVAEEEKDIRPYVKEIIETQSRDAVILDVGCGIGRDLQVLYKSGFQQLHGLDIIPKPLLIAKTLGLSNVIVADCERLPYRDSSFDYCIVHNLIEHVWHPEELLKELRRVLKRDGIIRVNSPNAASFDDRILRWGGMLLHGRTSHIQKFNLAKLEDLFQKAHLSIIRRTESRGAELDCLSFDRIPGLSTFKETLCRALKNEITGWVFLLSK